MKLGGSVQRNRATASSLLEVIGLKVGDNVTYESLNAEPFINGTTTSLRFFDFNVLLHAPIGASKQTLVVNFLTDGKPSWLNIEIVQDPLNSKCLNLKMFLGNSGSILFNVPANYKLCEP